MLPEFFAWVRKISIHALREEGDPGDYTGFKLAVFISIHALREEGDQKFKNLLDLKIYFYPRPPRGGRQVDRFGLSRCHVISIHALREEGDVGTIL